MKNFEKMLNTVILVTEFRPWWHEGGVGDQRLKFVINSFCYQHPSPTSMKLWTKWAPQLRSEMIWLHKSCIFGHSNFKRTKFNPFMISHRRFFWFYYNCCQYRHWMLEISQTILKFGQSVWRIMASDQFISRTSGPLVPISSVRFAVRICDLIWFWNPDRIPDRAEMR